MSHCTQRQDPKNRSKPGLPAFASVEPPGRRTTNISSQRVPISWPVDSPAVAEHVLNSVMKSAPSATEPAVNLDWFRPGRISRNACAMSPLITTSPCATCWFTVKMPGTQSR